MTAARSIDPLPTLTDMSLATRLRAATREAHEQAENSPFVADLVNARVPLAAFAALVANHLAIYTALEDVPGPWTADLIAGPFATIAGLPRVAALRADLAALGVATDERAGDIVRRASGRDVHGVTDMVVADDLVTEPTREYVARLHEVVAADRPDLWVAHHYVRYLGDVSGGQVVAQAVRRGYGDAGANAVAFYDFSAVGPPPRFRERYRALLDAAPVPDPDAVLTEAVDAFHRNRAVFEALHARFPAR